MFLAQFTTDLTSGKGTRKQVQGASSNHGTAKRAGRALWWAGRPPFNLAHDKQKLL